MEPPMNADRRRYLVNEETRKPGRKVTFGSVFLPSWIPYLESVFSSAYISVHRRFLVLGLVAGVTLPAFGQKAAVVSPTPTYASIEPIFKARCVVCHNQAALNNPALSGGLALDSFAAMKKGVVGKDGATPVFVAGKSAKSELVLRLQNTSPTRLMPKGGPPLMQGKIALIAKWIDAGAPEGKVAPANRAPKTPKDAPMPANPAALDVPLPTLLKPTPDLIKKETPKDASLAFALKVGPLPQITALAYSPDGKRLAVGGYRAVMIWDTTSGKPTACLALLSGSALGLAFRPDGTQLAVAGGATGAGGEVRVYDAKTFALVGSPLVGHTDVVYSVAWSPDGSRLATASHDKTARLWEWPSGKELKTFKDHSDAVTRVCFAPDGKSVYTASQDHNVRRFDVATGAVLKVFTGHSEAVTALVVKDGGRIVSAGVEPRLRWWNVENGETTNYNDGHGAPINELVLSKDGKMFASASADATVRLWNENGGAIRALAGATDWLYAVALSPDVKFAAGAGSDGLVRIWETATGRLRLTLLAWPPTDKSAAPEWAALTPEGYFDASSDWAARLHPQLAGKPVTAPRFAAWVKTLQQPESVAKAWQGAALEPAKLPEPAPAIAPKR